MTDEEPLTLDELTMIFAAVGSSEDSPNRRALLKMMRYEPLAGMYKELLQMADDARTPRHLEGWERTAYEDNATFDWLLGAVDQDPKADDLDWNAFSKVDRRVLLDICEARKRRCRGDRELLIALERRLLALEPRDTT